MAKRWSYLHAMKKKYEHTIKRKEQAAAGAFDGRFRMRVVVDKKKKAARVWARKSK